MLHTAPTINTKEIFSNLVGDAVPAALREDVRLQCMEFFDTLERCRAIKGSGMTSSCRTEESMRLQKSLGSQSGKLLNLLLRGIEWVIPSGNKELVEFCEGVRDLHHAISTLQHLDSLIKLTHERDYLHGPSFDVRSLRASCEDFGSFIRGTLVYQQISRLSDMVGESSGMRIGTENQT